MIGVHPASLHVVILAAGFSVRLGEPKALARIGGLSLLRRTIALAVSLQPEKVTVVSPRNCSRYRVEARGFKVRFTANSRRSDGLASSVRRGMAQARYSAAVLLLPVDLAALRREDLARLISRWRAAPRCVIARRIGSKAGTPLLLPRWRYPDAQRIAGDLGLREWASGLPARELKTLELPSAAWDIDTPQDLRRARRALRRNGLKA